MGLIGLLVVGKFRIAFVEIVGREVVQDWGVGG